jgi:hypothetical protein
MKNTCSQPLCIRIDDTWEELPPGDTRVGDVDGFYSGGKQYKVTDCFDATISCPEGGLPDVDLDYVGFKNCKHKKSFREKYKCWCKCDYATKAWALQKATGGVA